MAALNVDFTGDCTGLINAANRSKAEVRSFDGMRATAAVSLAGASGVVSDLGKVQSAVGSAGGTVAVGMDTSGIAAGRAEIAGARADVRAFGREADALGGARAFSLTDGGSIQQANRELSGMRQTLKGASEDFQATSRAGAESSSALESSYDRVGTAAKGMGGQVEASTAKLRQHAMAMAGGGVGSSVEASATAGSSTMQAFERDLASTGNTAEQAARQLESVNSAVGGGGPPPSIGDDGGRGGGKPPRPPGGEGGILSGDGGEGFGGGGSAMRALGMPVMIGAAIGLAEAAGTAAIGMMAVNAVVKDTPALAYASGKAMHQLADGIREGSQGATAAGVPAFQALGAALKPLGVEIGQIGKANIGNILGAETTLASGATQVLRNLAPAIAPAIAGFTNLGVAIEQGLSAPAVEKSVAALGNALSSPAVQSGVANLVQMVATVAPPIAAVVGRAAASLGNNGAPTSPSGVGSGIWSQPAGETVAEHSGGAFSYNPATDTGDQGGSVPLPGLGFGVHWGQNSMLGTGMTAIGSGLTLAGRSGWDMATGQMGSDSAGRQQAKQDFQERMGRALTPGGADLPSPGATAAPSSAAQDLAASRAAAPHGYDQDPKTGALTPSSGPSGGGGWWPGGPGTGGSGVQSVQPPGLGAPTPKPAAPAFGGISGGGLSGPTTQNAAGVRALNAALAPTNQTLQQTGSSATSASAGLSRMAPASSQVSTGLQQMQQSAASAGAPMAAMAQHTTAATSAVQNLTQQAPQAVSAVQQIAPAAHQALTQAGAAVQSGGQTLGAQMPTAVAAGVAASAPQASAASCAMVNNAAKSAADCLKTQSPSKVFATLGLSTGQGLAIGIQNSTPLAVAATQSAMQQVVAAGQAGLQTASPSRTFQAMGAQHAADASKAYTAGVQQQTPAAPQQSSALFGDEKRQAEQKKKQDQAKKDASANSPQAQSDAAFAAQLEHMGYSPATQARLEAQRKAQQDRNKAQQSRKDDAQTTAMEASGFRVDSNNPDSPHNQRAAQLKAGRDILKTNAQGLVNEGLTSQDPAAVARRLSGRPGSAGDAAQQRSMNEQGRGMGDSFSKGVAGGIDKGAGGPAGAAGKAGEGSVNEIKKKTKTHSPSEVTFGIGGDLMAGLSGGISAGQGSVASAAGDAMSGAFGSGVTAASNGVMGIASNSGLAVGYQWARGVSSGADSVLKTSDFGQVSLPQIGSALAKTALGAGGMLGPAGSGASIPNHLTITMGGAGTPAAPPIVNTYVSIDGTQLRAMTRTEIESVLNTLSDSIPQQVG